MSFQSITMGGMHDDYVAIEKLEELVIDAREDHAAKIQNYGLACESFLDEHEINVRKSVFPEELKVVFDGITEYVHDYCKAKGLRMPTVDNLKYDEDDYDQFMTKGMEQFAKDIHNRFTRAKYEPQLIDLYKDMEFKCVVQMLVDLEERLIARINATPSGCDAPLPQSNHKQRAIRLKGLVNTFRLNEINLKEYKNKNPVQFIAEAYISKVGVEAVESVDNFDKFKNLNQARTRKYSSVGYTRIFSTDDIIAVMEAYISTSSEKDVCTVACEVYDILRHSPQDAKAAEIVDKLERAKIILHLRTALEVRRFVIGKGCEQSRLSE